MKNSQYTAIALLLLLVCGSLAPVVGQSVECSSGDVIYCALANRICLVGSNSSLRDESPVLDPECGPCGQGFFEWEARVGRDCIAISRIQVEDFVEKYHPTYEAEDDSVDRLALVLEAVEFIGEYLRESANGTATRKFELGLTPFSADTPQEQAQRAGFRFDINRTLDMFGSQVPDPPSLEDVEQSDAISLAETIDWVEKGAVTEVKDQGRCGCCWAVAMVAAIEGAAAANNGYLQNLSWQQLISCNDGNAGCNGGSIVLALGYSWLNAFGGITRFNEYPFSDYKGDTTDSCNVQDMPLAVTIDNPRIVVDFNPPIPFDRRVRLMKEALQVATIAMTIKSSCRTLSNYRSGILTDDGGCACSVKTCIDHAILMVGYDDTSDPPSWRLKNSWGTKWGEEGYFRISQEEKGPFGLFGVVGHGVQAQMAQNVTGQVDDDEIDESVSAWVWILIALGAGVCLGALAVKLM